MGEALGVMAPALATEVNEIVSNRQFGYVLDANEL
jgi:hypothetical protein